MAGRENFVNFRMSDNLRDMLDNAAKQNGWSRSQQVRAMLEAAFEIEIPQPYIPVPKQRSNQLGFGGPVHETPGRKSRRLRAT